MSREGLIGVGLIVLGLLFLLARGLVAEHGFGKAYVEVVEYDFAHVEMPEPYPNAGEMAWVNLNTDAALDYTDDQIAQADRIQWTVGEQATPGEFVRAEQQDPSQDTYRFSWSRTIGLWVGAFFTLAIFSFLYRDNPLYKIAESVVVGVSAAYWMVVGFWDTIVPNLIAKLTPAVVQAWSSPGTSDTHEAFWWIYFIPLALGIMLLMRLSPVGGWISRWPLAFIIGTTAGLRLIAYIHGDFLAQIRASIVEIVVMEAAGGVLWWDSFWNIVLILGTLACLTYFFFSIEHKGAVGATARVGIWVLMITFGAAFGYTVMGRIALLAIRLEFLFDDWLWLIDPTNKRAALEAAVALVRLRFGGG